MQQLEIIQKLNNINKRLDSFILDDDKQKQIVGDIYSLLNLMGDKIEKLEKKLKKVEDYCV